MRRLASTTDSAWASRPLLRPVAPPIRPPEETTADGLVRVPSRSVGGVYRAPEATFTQYRRIILEPPSISFIKDWRKKHPEVSPTELARIRSGISAVVSRRVHARIRQARSVQVRGRSGAGRSAGGSRHRRTRHRGARKPGDAPGDAHLSTGRPVTMKVTGDLRDASTGKIVGRVITYQPARARPIQRDARSQTARPTRTSSGWCSRNGR